MVDQRRRVLLIDPQTLAHHLFDGRVSAEVAVLFAKSFEDSLLGVTLFAVDVLVQPQNLIDNAQVGPDLAFVPWLSQPVSRRLAVFEDLAQRVPVDPKLLTHAPFALAFDEHQPPNLCPLVHVGKHL